MANTHPAESNVPPHVGTRRSSRAPGDQPFSAREGLGGERPLIYDDAPHSLRSGLREVLHVLGYELPTDQRRILCKAFRVMPDQLNWSEYPNVDDEVSDLIATSRWYEFFDALERVYLYLPERQVKAYYDRMNALLADERVGYRFESGILVRVGTDEFLSAVKAARSALGDARFAEPRRQLERAFEFRNARPPDWANAIKDAVISVEGVLQIVYGRHGVSLTNIIGENLPDKLPGGIKKMFRSLYSQGSGTIGARHASIGGNEPTGPRAELAIHIASALHAFIVAELDNRP